MRSFDPVRSRPLPDRFAALVRGESITVTLDHEALLFAVKPGCFSCQSVMSDAAQHFPSLQILFVAGEDAAEWELTPHAVHVAPQFLEVAEVKFPPVYLLVRDGLVVAEGALLSSAQVKDEIDGR